MHPFLVLTATAPVQMREELICTLTPWRNPSNPIAEELKESLIQFPLTIIYLPLKWCGYMFKLFMEELRDKSYVPSDKRIPKNCLFAQYRADGAKCCARVLIPPGYLHPGKQKH